MSLWRQKLGAFAVHFAATLLLAAAAATLVFVIWFPEPFQTMVGGAKLFMLVVGCDLALGPLISLVIYNPTKPRKQLLVDYAVVVAVQLAAMVYGVYVISNSRPVYVAFVKDRLEVVTAGEIEDADLDAARRPEYRSLPNWGARLVGTKVLPQDHNEALFSGLAGKDVALVPKYYVPYESELDDVRRRSQPLDLLAKHHPSAPALIAAAQAELKVPPEKLRWLPVKHRTGFWSALVNVETGVPVRYLPIDPPY
ncbi:MAG TPA: TfpX/TfpZ family type IV pilin accessory protein [Steroidobacter sp.]|nr:TfpX/TfpZ family type IV pilin accessory protein [Steroidobacter sp.]